MRPTHQILAASPCEGAIWTPPPPKLRLGGEGESVGSVVLTVVACTWLCLAAIAVQNPLLVVLLSFTLCVRHFWKLVLLMLYFSSWCFPRFLAVNQPMTQSLVGALSAKRPMCLSMSVAFLLAPWLHCVLCIAHASRKLVGARSERFLK